MAILVTGEGFQNVLAQYDADLYCGITGGGILPVGSRLANSIPDANIVRVADGMLVTAEGRTIIIPAGTYDDFDIPVGSSGATGYYVIGYRLYTDDGVRTCEKFVYAAASATDLPANTGTLREGAAQRYEPLYRVTQVGLSISQVTPLVETLEPLSSILTLENRVDRMQDDIMQEVGSTLSNYFYQPGTTIRGVVYGSGYVTTSGKEIWCNVALKRPLDPQITAARITELKMRARQNGKYIYGSAGARASFDVSKANCYIDPFGLNIILAKTEAYTGAINNAPVGVEFEARIAFS